MSKANKANKRKNKLKARKRQEEMNRLALADILTAALLELCLPDWAEYVDDTGGIDIGGRKILFDFGQVAWNASLEGETDPINFMDLSSLDDDEQKIFRDEIVKLVKEKNTRWPHLRNRIEHVSVQFINGKTVMKVKPGIYTPAPDIEIPPALPEPITPEAIFALRKKRALTQVVFAQNLGVSARTVSAWEHGRSRPSKQQEELIRKMMET